MSREIEIKRIKAIIKEWGTTTACELSLGSSPCINSIGSGKNNVSQLVERFNSESVTAVTYHDQTELGEEEIAYEDLSDDILSEVVDILEVYNNNRKNEKILW